VQRAWRPSTFFTRVKDYFETAESGGNQRSIEHGHSLIPRRITTQGLACDPHDGTGRGPRPYITLSALGPGIVRTQEFISRSFCNKSRRVALPTTWSTATCTARQSDRTEQSTERVQIGCLAGCWLSQKSLSNKRPPSASSTWPMTMVPAGRASL